MDSPILYHLLGNYSRVFGNKGGYIRSSQYPTLLHYFSHISIWLMGSWHWTNFGICTCVVSFFPPNRWINFVEAVVQSYIWDWCVSCHLVSCLMKFSTTLCSQPCSPKFLDTSSMCATSDYRSLYLNGGIFVNSFFVGIIVGYSLISFSNI